MRALTLAAALALAGCASPPRSPDAPAADRPAGLSLLRLGQPYLGGALEVTRFSAVREGGRLRLAVSVANRTPGALSLRWRFRFVDDAGWERRTRDSAAWSEATLASGEEWRWEGDVEVREAVAAGMDWRHVRGGE